MKSEKSASTAVMIVYPSVWKLAGISVCCFLFVLIGFYMFAASWNGQNNVFIGIVGLAAVLFFGFCGLYCVYRLVLRKPAIVVDERGITDNASAVSVGLVRWDEIAELIEYEVNGQTFLGVIPKDIQLILNRLPALKRSALKANTGIGVAAINIPQVILPISVRELLERIETRKSIPYEEKQ